MIRYGAEHGWEWIEWTTGAQQVARYTGALRKAVDMIEWTKTDKGVQLVGYKHSTTARDESAGLKRVNSTKVVDTTETETALSDAIGKSMAERIKNDPNQSGTIEGDNIQIDDTGMAGFYDRIVPSVAKDVLKKLGGGKLSAIRLNKTDGEKINKTEVANAASAYIAGDISFEEFQQNSGLEDSVTEAEVERDLGGDYDMLDRAARREAAQDYAAKMAGALAGQKHSVQTGFEITPELAERALGGMPMFSRISKLKPKGTVGAVYLANSHRNLYGNFEGSGEVYLLPDGRVRIDDQIVSPGDTLYVSENGRMVKELPPEEIKAVEKMVAPYVATLTQRSLEINRSVAKASIPRNISPDANWMDTILANKPEWEAHRYPKARPGWGSDINEYTFVDSISEKHDPDAILSAVVQQHIEKHQKFVAGGFLHLSKEEVSAGLSREKVAAILAYQDRGGRLGKSALDALGGQGNAGEGAFSRSGTYTDLAGVAREELGNMLQSQRTFNRWWHRTVGTQFHKAQQDLGFKRVFDIGQDYLTDTSRYAMQAEAEAPNLLLSMEGFKDILKRGISKADRDAIATPIFEGTLEERLVSEDDLRTVYGLNERQINYVREFRNATNKSLEEMAKSTLAKMASTVGVKVPRGQGLRDLDFSAFHAEVISMVKKRSEWLAEQAKGATGTDKPLREAKAREARTQAQAMTKMFNKVRELQEKGYAPLMRFGEYTVYVQQVGESGELEQVYFGMYETQRTANAAAKGLAQEFPDAVVTQGVLSKEAWRLFQGLSPDTLEVFAKASGLDAEPLFQQYLRLAVNNRSAMKRLMKRKGTPGFSQDVTRVLASFVTSNARLTSSNWHLGQMQAAVDKIPTSKGDVKDEAINLWKYLTDPQEEAGALRGFLFFQYLGGSIASALVNATQPVTMTAPYLAKYASPADVAAGLTKAGVEAARNAPGKDVRQAYNRATEEGVVAPHEIYQLMAQARGNSMGATGMGRALKIWGAFFSLAESFNRRTTFIAAYRLGVKNAVADPYEFAKQAVYDTQGLYNRGNRPNWFRGPVGATLGTFKQFSIAYIEFLKRLHDSSKGAFWLAIAILALAAGIEGLPFAEDIEDILDTIGQWMGHSTNSRKWLRERAVQVLGEGGAEFVLHGISGIPGVPLDVSNRMGMHNLIPGTAALKPSETNKGRDTLELLGPAGGLLVSAGRALEAGAKGDIGKAVRNVLPNALQNLFKGAEMWEKGYYTDTRGRRVLDSTGGEAIMKAAGFQPANVAAESRKIQTARQDIELHRTTEAAIADKWARGVVDKRPDLIDDARADLRRWNEKNPDERILLKPEQIRRRVLEMNKTRAERFVKTSPPEIRGQVARQIQ